jgi:hypothetical protein
MPQLDWKICPAMDVDFQIPDFVSSYKKGRQAE